MICKVISVLGHIFGLVAWKIPSLVLIQTAFSSLFASQLFYSSFSFSVSLNAPASCAFPDHGSLCIFFSTEQKEILVWLTPFLFLQMFQTHCLILPSAPLRSGRIFHFVDLLMSRQIFLIWKQFSTLLTSLCCFWLFFLCAVCFDCVSIQIMFKPCFIGAQCASAKG